MPGANNKSKMGKGGGGGGSDTTNPTPHDVAVNFDTAKQDIYRQMRVDALINDKQDEIELFHNITGRSLGRIDLSGFTVSIEPNTPTQRPLFERAAKILRSRAEIGNLQMRLNSLNHVRDIPERKKIETQVAALEKQIRDL